MWVNIPINYNIRKRNYCFFHFFFFIRFFAAEEKGWKKMKNWLILSYLSHELEEP